MPIDTNISNIIIDDVTKRYCEIYKIICLETKKIYVGQAVSHILNHNRYRPYGRKGRFKCHISEAFSKKTKQCHYLNNAIRKYGVDKFTVELITVCSISNADKMETYYINKYSSLCPNGYNLNTGGTQFNHTIDSRKRVSEGVIKYYKNRKFKRFIESGIKEINSDSMKYIRPLNRYKKQYGWYVYINGKKADFGGVHISLENSKIMALKFINELKILLAKRLVAGSSLESSTTTS
jgi:hypothetical protein